MSGGHLRLDGFESKSLPTKKPHHKVWFLLAEDEGFEFAKESPLVAKRPHLVSLSSDQFSKCTVCTIWHVV